MELKAKLVFGALAGAGLLAACGGGSVDGSAAQQGAGVRMGASVVAAAATAFGVTQDSTHLTVSSGGGLVFKVAKTGGSITSIKVNDGAQLQNQSTSSHISSGLGSTAVVSYTASGTVAKVTVATATVTHYMLVRSGENTIYMGTHVTAEPSVGELRWITRLNRAPFSSVPVHSDNLNSTGAIESSDVNGHADGTTTSKFYGNQRAKDLTVRGVTGSGIGVFMAYGNRESASGGPFFRDIQNQSGGGAEVYNYMNSGHAQTEDWRLGFHGPYALIFTDGGTPAVPAMTWMGDHGLTGWVAASGRGKVVGNGLSGRDTAYTYTVGFANTTAQYWTDASASNGSFITPSMKPGAYTMTVYKNELAVYTESVTVSAGATTTLNTRTITGDPSAATALWRIGNWDGTPLELKNGANIPLMHPSDARNASWGPVTFAVGAAANTFPAAQWKTSANSPTTVTFNLTAAQVAARTIRIGITTAYAGGRPNITVNSWSSTAQAASSQPDSRSLTIGTYRGNNKMYTFSVPASAFVVGSNTLTIGAISGSSGTGFLSPGFGFDAVDLL